MKEIKFDFNNMFSLNIGKAHGVSTAELKASSRAIQQAHEHLRTVIIDSRSRVNLGLEWVRLPFQDKDVIRRIQRLGNDIAKKYRDVIFLGIGGSYLGLKAAQDALCPPYYNEFASLRKGRPRVYFEGNNLDPGTLKVLLKNLDPKKTFVVVISKSGETIETKAAFCVMESWLKQGVGPRYGRQVFAITDPESGSLRRRVNLEQSKDSLSFRNLPLLRGVGGRYSELNIGLLHLAIVGINLAGVLAGAAAMAKRCTNSSIFKNPAYMYAVMHHILHKKKGKSIAILMPFREMLKSTADWYAQLLAESLGKKYARRIKLNCDASQIWEMDKTLIVNAGRTPVASRGTGDLHSIQQNNIEGSNDKVITFIRTEALRSDIRVPASGDFLSAKLYSELLNLAEEATEWALARAARPNCCIRMPELTPYYWGGLIFFFEMATAFEGELLNINAFDQPGVEGYKNYMYYRLGKQGLALKVTEEIKAKPLVKKSRFII